MDERKQARRNRSRGLRDLLLISLAALVLFWLGVSAGSHSIHRWIDSHDTRLRDEVFLGVTIAASALLLFALLRWRDARRQIRSRAAADSRYRTLVDQMPVVTYVLEAAQEGDPVVRAIGPGIEQLLGYTQEEWLSSPDFWRRRIHPDDRETVLAESRRTDETGDPFSMEYRLMGPDGRVVWVRDDAVLVGAERRDRVEMWQGMLLDITKRKLAEERLAQAETRYRSLVETIPAVTYVDLVDELSSTVYVSPQLEVMLGYTPEEWAQDPVLWMRSVHPDDLYRVVDASIRHNETGDPYDQEYRIRTADGRWLWVRDQAAVLRGEDGLPLFSQGVMTDITDRKQAEEALRVSERREREAAERLRGLDEMKNTFLAAVSHELRSPLTSILGLAVTLEHQDLAEEERRDLRKRLVSNARKLDDLLRDLLDIDRLSRGIVEPRYRPTELGALARRTVENLDVPRERRVLLEVQSVTVEADPPKVERILENLLANAFRHTPVEATVWVRVQTEDGGGLLIVEDDGPGVPRHLQKAIFKPFLQGPTASPHSPGTGIGLSLVAMFAELHGGRAWVEEREGGGASFRVFLPTEPLGIEEGTLDEEDSSQEDASHLDEASAG
jgi:PAS domain S-box-containing protein